jgi:anti-sigma B factor antagonist
MDITEEKRGDVRIIGLRGRLDASSSPGVEQRLLCLIDQGERRLVLDFSELNYISSIGMRALIATAKSLQKTKGRLALAALNNHVQEIFRIAGFTSIFSIYPTCEEAVAFSQTGSGGEGTTSIPPTAHGD